MTKASKRLFHTSLSGLPLYCSLSGLGLHFYSKFTFGTQKVNLLTTIVLHIRTCQSKLGPYEEVICAFWSFDVPSIVMKATVCDSLPDTHEGILFWNWPERRNSQWSMANPTVCRGRLPAMCGERGTLPPIPNTCQADRSTDFSTGRTFRVPSSAHLKSTQDSGLCFKCKHSRHCTLKNSA